MVHLPKGTRLFKATQYKEEWTRSPLSPWWSTVECYEENEHSAYDLLRIANENGVSFRQLVRFISAVSLDWNKLDWYVEIVLKVDLYAFWGQFAPQKGIQQAGVQGTTVTTQADTGGSSTYVDHGDSQAEYLPDILGGFGAWQLYIPDFDKHCIDPSRIHNISATDNRQLATYLKPRQ
ncbi:MAG: hypothetical protein R3E95_24275 [Thiolinea sp.]